MEQVLSENNLVISVDAMGGDNSPRIVVEGIAKAHKNNSDIKFLLFGDEAKVGEEMKRFPNLKKFCTLVHTSERVRNEDKPSQVIRNKNTSMYMAIDAVRQGQARAVVSAGNTGALMAISKMILKTIQKIHRPAICTLIPHKNGQCVMLDLGANTECDAINLAEFAFMGEIGSEITFDGKRNYLIRSDFACINPCAGLEVSFMDMAFVRFGISDFMKNNHLYISRTYSYVPSLGAGIKVSRFSFDYAFMDASTNSYEYRTNVFTLGARF
jgi:hypothetical protein